MGTSRCCKWLAADFLWNPYEMRPSEGGHYEG